MGLDAAMAWLASNLVVPFVSWIWGKLGREVPGWAARMREFARRKWLESRVSDDEIVILGSIAGRQQNYAHIQREMAGRLEGDSLLVAVTSLQALGLLSEPRLSQPPDPAAMFTITHDAMLVLKPRKAPARPKARKRDVPEAASRRKRIAANVGWHDQHESSLRAGFIPDELTQEANRRSSEIAADQSWLSEHGF